jgi:hypothetical protein
MSDPSRPKPFTPRGAIDGVVADANMIKNMGDLLDKIEMMTKADPRYAEAMAFAKYFSASSSLSNFSNLNGLLSS